MERGEGGEGGEEYDLDADDFVTSGVTITILSVMIIFSILFEKGRENIEESTPESLKPILDSLFGELTLLGFIGLILFIASKCEAVQIMSMNIFGEEEAINELSEGVHMGLFLVMLIFLATVLLLVQFGTEIVARWQAWEDTILAEALVRERYHSIHDKTHGAMRYCAGLDHAILGLEPEEFQEAAYSALRKEFIGEARLDDHFDFAEYLEPRLGHMLAEFVEIPVSTWMMLELFTLVVWIVIMNTSKSLQAFLYLIIGYSLPLTLRAVHGKAMHIKGDATITGGHLETMLDEHKKALRVPNRAREATPLLDATKETSEVGDAQQGSYGGMANQTAGPSTPPQHKILPDGATNSTMQRRSSQPAKAFASFHAPRRYDPASLVAHYGISGHDAREHHKRFWFGERYKGKFMHGIIRSCLLVNAIYLAVFILMFLPGILSEEANLSWTAIILLVPLTLLPSVALVNMISDVIQDFVLVTSIHSMKSNRVIEQAVRRMKTRFAFLTLKVVYMMITGTKRDRKRADAGELSGVNVWRAEQEKKKVARRKLKGGIRAAMFANKLGLKAADTRCPAVQVHAFTDDDLNIENEELDEDTLKQRKTEAAVAMRQERVWKEIFSVFDADGGGSITRDELKEAVMKMAPQGSIGDADVDYMVSELDENHDDDISFDEFFSYSQYIMSSIASEQTEEQIAHGMFTMVDRDTPVSHGRGGHGGETSSRNVQVATEDEEVEPTISIPELQEALKNCGQELSADDVYNVIKDIDENGDGQLDHEEFQTLLEKLNVL